MRCLHERSGFHLIEQDVQHDGGSATSGRFDASLALRVLYREPGQCTVLLGETPTADGAGVEVPESPHWGVEPVDADLDDSGFAALARLVAEADVPGLHLPGLSRLTSDGLAHLAGIESLRWLSFECCWTVRGDPGLPFLASLPGLRDLNLGSHVPRAEEILALRNLEVLRAPCAGLSAEAFAALGSCSGLRVLDLTDGPPGYEAFDRLDGMSRLEELHLGTSAHSPSVLPLLARHTALRCLTLDQHLDAVAIDELSRLPHLEHLHDFSYPEQSEELQSLHRLTGLRILDGWPVPGPGVLPHLARLPHLEILDLNGSEVRDADLSNIANLRELRALVLRNTWTTDAGLSCLADLRALELLDLSLTKVTDAGLSCLSGRTNLRRLNLDLCTAVTGRGLAHLPADASLTTLSATGSGFDEEGLATLERLPNLREVELGRTRISQEALARFIAKWREPSA